MGVEHYLYLTIVGLVVNFVWHKWKPKDNQLEDQQDDQDFQPKDSWLERYKSNLRQWHRDMLPMPSSLYVRCYFNLSYFYVEKPPKSRVFNLY